MKFPYIKALGPEATMAKWEDAIVAYLKSAEKIE